MLVIILICSGMTLFAFLLTDSVVTSCTPDDQGMSRREIKLISSLRLINEYEWYRGENCSGHPVRKFTYVYLIRENLDTHMEVQLTSFTITPYDLKEVEVMNKTQFCEHSMWQHKISHETSYPGCLAGKRIGGIYQIKSSAF